MASEQTYVQRDQPPGVPPLELTGERTLPDVPEENYWFRRHLVVYEWIAGGVPGGWRNWSMTDRSRRKLSLPQAAVVCFVDASSRIPILAGVMLRMPFPRQ